jgi:hypothetical protein
VSAHAGMSASATGLSSPATGVSSPATGVPSPAGVSTPTEVSTLIPISYSKVPIRYYFFKYGIIPRMELACKRPSTYVCAEMLAENCLPVSTSRNERRLAD